MNKEQEAIYETYFEMFSSKGWQNYLVTVKEEKENTITKTIYDARTEHDLGRAQGAIHYLDLVLNLENTIENMYDEAKRQNKEEEKEEDDKNYIEQIEDGG